jgi:hypothetical protein
VSEDISEGVSEDVSNRVSEDVSEEARDKETSEVVGEEVSDEVREDVGGEAFCAKARYSIRVVCSGKYQYGVTVILRRPRCCIAA